MMTASVTPAPTHMDLFDKVLLLAALGIAVALFLTIGWMAVAPDDPRGAVSLLARERGLPVVLQAGLLAAVTAAIATVMIGGKLADVGVFAAALGMGLVSVQGDTTRYLLIVANGSERALAGKLAVEALVWFALVLVAQAVSGMVTYWCASAGRRFAADATGDAQFGGGDIAELSVSECPVLGRWFKPGAKASARSSGWNGVRTTAVMTVAGALLYGVLVSGSSPQMVRHGQTCFAVFMAFYLGGWFARRMFPTRTAFWGILAVPLTCVLGYVWAMVSPGQAGRIAQLATVPTSDFLRALPITFIAVGTLGALTAHWTVEPGSHGAKSGDRSNAASRGGQGRR